MTTLTCRSGNLRFHSIKAPAAPGVESIMRAVKTKAFIRMCVGFLLRRHRGSLKNAWRKEGGGFYFRSILAFREPGVQENFRRGVRGAHAYRSEGHAARRACSANSGLAPRHTSLKHKKIARRRFSCVLGFILREIFQNFMRRFALMPQPFLSALEPPKDSLYESVKQRRAGSKRVMVNEYVFPSSRVSLSTLSYRTRIYAQVLPLLPHRETSARACCV